MIAPSNQPPTLPDFQAEKYPSMAEAFEAARFVYGEEGKRREALDTKASLALAAVAAVLAILSILNPQFPRLVLSTVIVLFVVAGTAFWAMYLRDYHVPHFDLNDIFGDAKKQPTQASGEFILDIVKAVEQNRRCNEQKTKYVDFAYFSLLAALVLLVVNVLFIVLA